MEIITRRMNRIYNSGITPEGFVRSIFTPIPKVKKADQCSDFITISLISHISKSLLHLLKKKTTPIIEKHLAETQMGFRKGKGTRDAIFSLRAISERVKKMYVCFVYYQKAIWIINWCHIVRQEYQSWNKDWSSISTGTSMLLWESRMEAPEEYAWEKE